jgi:protein gp37
VSTTNIEWADKVWNPIAGCSVISPGCTNCYAMAMAYRLEAISIANEANRGGDPGPLRHYRDLTKETRGGPVWTGKIAIASELTMMQPLRWKKPARIFVNSMSDLFHEAVPNDVIDRVFAVMALAPQHTFLVLTKRAERMRDWVSAMNFARLLAVVPIGTWPISYAEARAKLDPAGSRLARALYDARFPELPLPNVWLGVSVEDQARADARIPLLLATPAAVRWISAEPQIGPIDLRRWLADACPNCLRPECAPTLRSDGAEVFSKCGRFVMETPRSLLDWVVAGGESGPGARPMHPDWARTLRDQCEDAGVPFFFKQWGAWKHGSDFAAGNKVVTTDGRVIAFDQDAIRAADRDAPIGNPQVMRRVGKAAAGRELDGRTHDAFPTPRRLMEASMHDVPSLRYFRDQDGPGFLIPDDPGPEPKPRPWGEPRFGASFWIGYLCGGGTVGAIVLGAVVIATGFGVRA